MNSNNAFEALDRTHAGFKREEKTNGRHNDGTLW